MNDPHRVTVNGPTKLVGRKIASPDLARRNHFGFGGAHCKRKNED